jgi:hypothetical protein
LSRRAGNKKPLVERLCRPGHADQRECRIDQAQKEEWEAVAVFAVSEAPHHPFIFIQQRVSHLVAIGMIK